MNPNSWITAPLPLIQLRNGINLFFSQLETLRGANVLLHAVGVAGFGDRNVSTLEAPVENDLCSRLAVLFHQSLYLLSLIYIRNGLRVELQCQRAVCDWVDLVVFEVLNQLYLSTVGAQFYFVANGLNTTIIE